MKVRAIPKEERELTAVANAVYTIFGVRTVPQVDFDRVKEDNERLKKQAMNGLNLFIRLQRSQNFLKAFIAYHRKWKPLTRRIARRLSQLEKERLLIDTESLPSSIGLNLKEAYACYANENHIACYILVLRVIELSVSHIYDAHHPPQRNKEGKPVFVTATQKLNWVAERKIIQGADIKVAKAFIESRNEAVHDVYKPTEKQILAAFETVTILISAMQIKARRV